MAQFKKGQSGNPGGRPKIVGEVQELARSHTTAAIETLAEIMQNEKAPCPARVAAASAILDRGWGKAPQNLHHSGGIDANLTERLDAAIKRAKKYDAARRQPDQEDGSLQIQQHDHSNN
jgi:hypothetical protein